MNTPTKVFTRLINDTGHGTDWYGLCEVCKQSVPTTSKLQTHRVWIKSDGTKYLSPIGGGAYGHAGCLIATFGDALAASQFEIVNGLPIVSSAQWSMINKEAS